MRVRKLRFKLTDGTFEYAIVALPHQADFSEARCDKCGAHLMMHGELLQWGFWEDTHTYLCKCVCCDRPIAVEQVMPLDWSVQSGEEQ